MNKYKALGLMILVVAVVTPALFAPRRQAALLPRPPQVKPRLSHLAVDRLQA
jgi:hypothetical protein